MFMYKQLYSSPSDSEKNKQNTIYNTYVGLFVHSAVVFHVFMFYVGLLIVRLCFLSDTVFSLTDCIVGLLIYSAV